MLLQRLTKIDNFNENIIDHDTIVENKKYFNIYNNSIDEPLHKFWFLIENTKFINIYDQTNTNSNLSNNTNQTIRFALNSKNEKTKKLLNYIQNLANHIQKLFDKTFKEIIIDYPWKNMENYPCMMNFTINENTIYTNESNKPKQFNEFNKDAIYSLLFDISYIQISSLIIDNITQYSLKFKLSLIMIQEKTIDLKLFSLNQTDITNTNTNSNTNTNTNTNTNILGISSRPPQNLINDSYTNMSNIPNIPNISNIQNKNYELVKAPMLQIDASQLLARKSTLNKITFSDNKVISTNQVDEIIDIKNQLKRVETDERSLMSHLKKEHDDSKILESINTNSKIKMKKKNKKKKLTINQDDKTELEIDLEKEFNELVNNN